MIENTTEFNDEINEINIRCRKNTKAIYSKYFLSDRERRELISDIGDAACMLYEYYLRMASIGDRELSDTQVAGYFGWSKYKAKRNRLALIRAGWFRSTKGVFSDGRKLMSYYIGQDAVQESRQGRGVAQRPMPAKPITSIIESGAL
jgi:hypothetical protein